MVGKAEKHKSFVRSILDRPLWIIVKAEVYASLRNHWFVSYGLSFAAFFSLVTLQSSGQNIQSIVSLLNIMLLLIPLFSMLFGSLSFSESVSFFELMLVHGVTRRQIIRGKYIGLVTSLSVSFLLGATIGLSAFLESTNDFSFIIILLLLGLMLNCIFLGLSLVIAINIPKKEVMLTIILLIWFYVYIIYDLWIMWFAVFFQSYPLELPILIMIFLNPLDLVRLVILLNLNLASSMSISVGLVQQILGGTMGTLLAVAILLTYIIGIFKITEWSFIKKDL